MPRLSFSVALLALTLTLCTSGCKSGELIGGPNKLGGGDAPSQLDGGGIYFDQGGGDRGVNPPGDRGVNPPGDRGVNPPKDKGVNPPKDKGVTPPTPDKGVPPQPDQGVPPALAAHHFPSGAVWYKDISATAKDSRSNAIISGLQGAGGWGSGTLRIDFSNHILYAKSGTPFRSFTKTGDHFLPDCDVNSVPIVPGGAIEEESGYRCDGDGDCHLLVVDLPKKRLYEMWRANISNASGSGGTFRGGCLVVWDLTRVYPLSGRGEQCTSADAAGFPIAPLLFTADEVKAGVIAHAIRFILPGSRIQNGVYVHPATHSTSGATGGSNMPPYGARFRLKASFNVGQLKPGARVVARALQKYGMLLSDQGNIPLTASSDRYTTAKWSGLLTTNDLAPINVSDFEMVAGGNRINYTGNCNYSP